MSLKNVLQKLPPWLLVALAVFLAVTLGYAVWDDREVELWGLKIHAPTSSPGPNVGPVQTPPPIVAPANPRQLPIVTFVDTIAREHIYHPGSVSNAHFLGDRLKNVATFALVEAQIKFVSESMPDPKDVAAEHPSVIVIHRSAFEVGPGGAKAGDATLRSFLEHLGDIDASILIYSRKPNTDAVFATQIANALGLRDRVYAYQFRQGDGFANAAVVDNFLGLIRALAVENVTRRASAQTATGAARAQ